ncbi:MAG: Uncharacterised protein [Cryomorphaceae bacterium]|nr:MAG: Uncharacterised protein [Cryomorphaceae bacterium]
MGSSLRGDKQARTSRTSAAAQKGGLVPVLMGVCMFGLGFGYGYASTGRARVRGLGLALPSDAPSLLLSFGVLHKTSLPVPCVGVCLKLVVAGVFFVAGVLSL